MHKINMKTVMTVALAIVSGITSFVGSIESQKKDELIKNMNDRLTNLENLRK